MNVVVIEMKLDEGGKGRDGVRNGGGEASRSDGTEGTLVRTFFRNNDVNAYRSRSDLCRVELESISDNDVVTRWLTTLQQESASREHANCTDIILTATATSRNQSTTAFHPQNFRCQEAAMLTRSSVM